MATLNPIQEEFLRLMEEAGWSDAETARRIDVSRSAISQIRSGKNTPEISIEKLRLAVASAPPKALAAKAGDAASSPQQEIVELRWRLEYLSRHDYRSFETVQQLINTLYDRAKVVNLGPDDVARVGLTGAVNALNENRPVVYGHSPEAGGTSGKTSSTKKGGLKH